MKCVVSDFGSTTDINDDSKLDTHLTTVTATSPEYAKTFAERAQAQVYYQVLQKSLPFDRIRLGDRAAQKRLHEAEIRCNQAERAFREANKEPSDIWSLGILFYQIVFQRTVPWLENYSLPADHNSPRSSYWQHLASVTKIRFPYQTKFNSVIEMMLCPKQDRKNIDEIIHQLNQL